MTNNVRLTALWSLVRRRNGADDRGEEGRLAVPVPRAPAPPPLPDDAMAEIAEPEAALWDPTPAGAVRLEVDEVPEAPAPQKSLWE